MAAQLQEPVFVFTGAYTGFPPHARGRADGVTVFRMQPETGALTHVFTQPGVDNPTFLAVSADHRFLYAINAVSEVDGVPGGAVEALSINPATGALNFLNRAIDDRARPGVCDGRSHRPVRPRGQLPRWQCRALSRARRRSTGAGE